MAIVLGAMFVVADDRRSSARPTPVPDRRLHGPGPDRRLHRLCVAIVASFVLAWALYASDYSRYLPPRPRSTARSSGTRCAAWPSPPAGSRSSGVLVADQQATGGESSDTIFALLGGSGSHHRHPGDGRDLHRHHRRQRDERLHRLALAAGGRRAGSSGSTRQRSWRDPRLPVHPRTSSTTATSSANFFNFLLFISYWISPFVGVVLADWWLRGRQADATSVVDYARLPSGHLGPGRARRRVRRRASRSRTPRSATSAVGRRRSTASPPTTSTAPTSRTTSAVVGGVPHLLVRRAQLRSSAA